MRVLIFGKVGQLATALGELLGEREDLTFLDQPDIDLSDTASIEGHVVSAAPELVINAAAYTAVDRAESEPELAHLINATAPGEIARICANASVPLIHVSTDYVFDGEAKEPYAEDSPVSPKSAYGKSKLAGELAVQDVLDQHIILRTAWLYSHVGHNFLKTMLRVASEGKPLRVVCDQYGAPTFAWDLGAALSKVVDAVKTGRRDIYGLYHATNSGFTNWHGFASQIFSLRGDEVDLSAISTREYPTPAPRPAYSVLSCERFCSVFNHRFPDWEDGLGRCLMRL